MHEELFSITLGKIRIVFYENHDIWLYHESGKGEQSSCEALASLIEQHFNQLKENSNVPDRRNLSSV